MATDDPPVGSSGDDLGSAGFEELVREVESRMSTALDQQERLRLLLDAVVTLAGDLTVDGVLARIVAVASSLMGARFAALGVLGGAGDDPLRTFIYHGIGEEEAVRIGHLPRGHGLLGLIIDRPAPLRLHDLSEHPASYGFPANHPPMHSFLGVPVRTRDKVFGNLYLTEKKDGSDFTAEDEEIAVALAAAAGVTIDNARLYEEATRREAWLQATTEITALLLGVPSGTEALQLIADRARGVAEADVAWIVAGSSPDDLRVRAISGVEADAEELRARRVSNAVGGRVVETGEPLLIADVAGERVSVSELAGWPVVGPVIVVPLGSPGSDARGALALGWAPEHADRHRVVGFDLPSSFARQAALALQVTQARADREKLAVLEDRDRIGRDLHDLVIQRLFAVGLGLQGTARYVERPEATKRIEQAVDDLDITIKDIRRSIFALGAAETTDDVQAEVTRLVDRVASALKFRPTLTFEGPIRTLVPDDVVPDLLAVLGEALSNAGRHAQAGRGSVRLQAGDELVLTVTDDGVGMEPDVIESGLANIRSRAEQRRGTLVIESAPGKGTTLRWAVPLR